MAVQNLPRDRGPRWSSGGRAADDPGRGRRPRARCRASGPCSRRWARVARRHAPGEAVRPPAIVVDRRRRRGRRKPEAATAVTVAELVEVDDPADPRLADYRDLRDVQLRKHLEAEHGLFLAEGEKVVRRAVEAGFPARSFLMAPRWLDGLADVLGGQRRALLRRVRGAGRAGHRLPRAPRRAGVAGAARRCRTVDEVLAGARTVVVLEDVVDHTNVGAIFRCGRRPRRRRGAARPALRRPALPALGQGRAWARSSPCRGPGSTTGTTPCRPSAAAGFTTVALTLADDAVDDRGGRGRARPGRPGAGHARATASRRAGSSPPTAVPSSRWRDGHRLPQRRGRHRGGLLRHRPPSAAARSAARPAGGRARSSWTCSSCRSGPGARARRPERRSFGIGARQVAPRQSL